MGGIPFHPELHFQLKCSFVIENWTTQFSVFLFNVAIMDLLAWPLNVSSREPTQEVFHFPEMSLKLGIQSFNTQIFDEHS